MPYISILAFVTFALFAYAPLRAEACDQYYSYDCGGYDSGYGNNCGNSCGGYDSGYNSGYNYQQYPYQVYQYYPRNNTSNYDAYNYQQYPYQFYNYFQDPGPKNYNDTYTYQQYPYQRYVYFQNPNPGGTTGQNVASRNTQPYQNTQAMQYTQPYQYNTQGTQNGWGSNQYGSNQYGSNNASNAGRFVSSNAGNAYGTAGGGFTMSSAR